MTILQVIPALETGGAERTVLEVGAAMVAAGGRSLVASEGGGMVAQLEAEGSQHFTLPVASKNPLVMWKNRRALMEIIQKEAASLIHARSRAPAWSALWAARATSIPFVTTYHGIYNAKSEAKRLYNSVMARGDRVIANSAYTAETVKAAYGDAPFFDDSRLVVIPRGADLTRFDPSRLDEARKSAVAQPFGGQGAYRILLPGRLTDWKGQRVLIKAAGLL
ncbi:MAG: glycosyltransferase, partial [Pseudomonadota bacterium]